MSFQHLALFTLLLSSVASLSPHNVNADTSQVVGSVDVKEDSTYFYVGGVTSLSGQDLLTQNSFLLRGSAGAGSYEYDTTGVAGNNVDGDVRAGDIMLGYQHYLNPTTRLTGYLGVSLENQDLSPNDPNAEVEGSEAGAKAQVELLTKLAPQIPLQAIGSYSTGFNTYWTQISTGYDLGAVTVGPEIGFQGNDAYNEQRYGVALSDIDLGGFAVGRISVGQSNSDRDNDSVYGNIGLLKNF